MAPTQLIVSIHIPKTAGTAFADVLSRNYGSAVGFLYGPGHPKTHPVLRNLSRTVTEDQLRHIEDAGIRVVHGHFSARRFLDVVPDPKNYWVWVRDPIERVVSEYFFNKDRDDADNPLARKLRERNLSLTSYAKRKRAANLQFRSIRPLDIDDFGFVGVTEFYDESLALSGLKPAPEKQRRKNVTHNKQTVTHRQRCLIAGNNVDDIALYSAALQRITRERRAR